MFSVHNSLLARAIAYMDGGSNKEVYSEVENGMCNISHINNTSYYVSLNIRQFSN